jgi:hypothetical protein
MGNRCASFSDYCEHAFFISEIEQVASYRCGAEEEALPLFRQMTKYGRATFAAAALTRIVKFAGG